MARRTWEQYEKFLLQQWPLTRREVQISIECIKGKKNKEIASLLGISAETVNKTLDHIYRATEVNGRDQLVAKLLIADIDNTPLQQTLTLTGEGAELVGAGFVSTLYASRGERKRPRSVRAGLMTAKNDEDRSEVVETAMTSGGQEQSEANAAGVVLHTSGPTATPEKPNPRRREDLPMMRALDPLIEKSACET
jgi:DNA-binding CsgD family transcriptional regulator